jgi:hypothetical protein
MGQTCLSEDLAQRFWPLVRWDLSFPQVRHGVYRLVPVGDAVRVTVQLDELSTDVLKSAKSKRFAVPADCTSYLIRDIPAEYVVIK